MLDFKNEGTVRESVFCDSWLVTHGPWCLMCFVLLCHVRMMMLTPKRQRKSRTMTLLPGRRPLAFKI